MTEIKLVTTRAVAERRVEWTPKGWSHSSSKVATIRDGEIYHLPCLEAYFVTADPDGCIEFFQAIKRAMAETKK